MRAIDGGVENIIECYDEADKIGFDYFKDSRSSKRAIPIINIKVFARFRKCEKGRVRRSCGYNDQCVARR